MSLTNRSGRENNGRPVMDVSSPLAQLSEVSDDLDTKGTAETLGVPNVPLRTNHGRSWHRLVGVSLLSVGLVAGVLLTMHNVQANKQAALHANQSSENVHIKSQTIQLSSLGLKPIGSLAQESNTLTVNGDLSVAGSVILNPSPTPSGGAIAGQLYYNQQKNQLGYYNGSGFVYLQGGTASGNVSNVSNVYNVNNVSNVTNISNFTNAVTGPAGVIPMFDGTGLTDSIINEAGTGVAVGANANTTTRFTITGATSDSTTNALTVTNSAGNVYAQVDDSGQVYLGRSPGAAFGNTALEPNHDTGGNGIITADKFTTTSSAVVTSMSIYIGGIGAYPYNKYQLAIYADSSGAPGTLVAVSTVGTLTANTWNTLPISATLAANTPYWLAYASSSNASWDNDPYYATTSSPTHAYAAFTFGSGSQAGMASSFPTPATINDYTHSFYATTVGTGSALTLNASGTLTSTADAVFKDLNNSTQAFQVQNSGGTAVLDVDTADGNVGIGTGMPNAARLSIVGATSDSTSSALSVTDSTGNTLAQVKDDGTVNLGEAHLSFGNTSSGNYTGGGYYNGSQELLQAQSFTTTTGGAISSISTYIGQAISGTNNLYQMAVYSNSAGAPSTIIASTAVGTLSSTGWNTLPISATLSPNTTYWLVYWSNTIDGNHNGQNFISGYSGPNTFYQSWATWQSGGTNGMPTAFPAGTGPSGGYETCIYATYSTAVSAVSLGTSSNITSNDSLLIQNTSATALQVNDATGGTALVVDSSTHEVGINTSSSNLGGFNFVVQGTTALGGTSNTQTVRIMDASGNALFNADTSGMILTVAGTTTTFATLTLNNAHFSSTQTTAPTIATPLNCGTSPIAVVTAGSTDSAGSFTLTAGSGTITGPCSVTITFNQAYGTVPKSVIAVPTTAVGTSPQGKSALVSSVSATSFTVTLPTNPTTGEVDAYYYWIIE